MTDDTKQLLTQLRQIARVPETAQEARILVEAYKVVSENGSDHLRDSWLSRSRNVIATHRRESKRRVVDNLTHLRTRIEDEVGLPIDAASMNVAALLDDVCRAVGLSDHQTRRVLGNGYDAIRTWPALDAVSSSIEAEQQELTKLEVELYTYFTEQLGRCCSHREIAEAVWGEGAFAQLNIESRIYRLVHRLRNKVGRWPIRIMTITGRGYKPVLNLEAKPEP